MDNALQISLSVENGNGKNTILHGGKKIRRSETHGEDIQLIVTILFLDCAALSLGLLAGTVRDVLLRRVMSHSPVTASTSSFQPVQAHFGSSRAPAVPKQRLFSH